MLCTPTCRLFAINGPSAITEAEIGAFLPLKKLFRSSQTFDRVSGSNQVFSKKLIKSGVRNQFLDHINQVLSKEKRMIRFLILIRSVSIQSEALDLIRKPDGIRASD
jgi:hypothetical protein